MQIAAIIALINTLLGVAFKLYESISQIQGTTVIPTWDELVSKNKLLQDRIDAEL